jgi:putative membrane protein
MKHDPGLQSRVVAAVKSIEGNSSMEVVVTLSPRAIRPTVPVLSSALAACLVILIVYPVLFADAEPLAISIDIFLVSAFVARITGSFPQLQRLFFSRRCMCNAALRAAQAEFVSQGIHNTTHRTGLLVYLSVFERQVVLVPDIGVRAVIPAEELERLEQAAAIYAAPDPDSRLMDFFELLRRTAGRYMPRQDDDVNELPDELRYS